MSISDTAKTVMYGMREPQLVFGKNTPIPESENKIEDSGPIFADSNTDLLPLIEVAISDSGVETLDELRQADQKNGEIAARHLAIQQHNNMIRDVFANRCIKTVRLDDNGETLFVCVQDGRQDIRMTRWSLKLARRVIPEKWYEAIPEKVIGILEDLNVSNPKDPRTTALQIERASEAAKYRAVMSYEERLMALSRYNKMLETRYTQKTLLSLKIENDGRSIALIDKFADHVQKTTWTFDRDGRFF